LLGLVSVARATWWLALLLALAAAVAWRRWTASPAGRARVDATLLRLPVAGRLLGRAAVARFARTLATLVASGVPLETALDVAMGGVVLLLVVAVLVPIFTLNQVVR